MSKRAAQSLAIGLAVHVLLLTVSAQANQGETSIEGPGAERVVVESPPNPLDERESLERLEQRGHRRLIAGGTLIPFGVLIPAIAIPLANSERWCDMPGESCQDQIEIRTGFIAIGAGVLAAATVSAGIGLTVRGKRMRDEARERQVDLQVGVGTLVVRGSF